MKRRLASLRMGTARRRLAALPIGAARRLPAAAIAVAGWVAVLGACGAWDGGRESTATPVVRVGPGEEGVAVSAAAAARGAALADSLLRRPGPPVGRNVARSLEYPPLRFDPPTPGRFTLSNGVSVFFLRDPTLPLVDVFVDVKGGYIYFDRERFAAGAGLLSLMRNGGTEERPPDSVDAVLENNALGLSTSTNGARMTIAISALPEQLPLALDLWSDILLRPRFDPDAVERWRRRELESVRRLPDLPGSLAVVEFNRLMYGDHSTGWRLTEADLAPERIGPDLLRSLHSQVACPENAVIGAAGDVDQATLRAELEQALSGWQPCGDTLVAPPPPVLRPDPRVYVLHRPIAQSTVVVGQPGAVRLGETEAYFASRIANWVLGGSGFSSRLVQRLRTDEGLAYSVASVWGVARDHERILGGITHTRAEATVEAARLMIETFARARSHPPDSGEVALARAAIGNGFVFGFSSPGQVVSRQVAYQIDGLPDDWLARYLEGIRSVDVDAVARVLEATIDTAAFTILVVGDTTRFDATALGPVEYLTAGG